MFYNILRIVHIPSRALRIQLNKIIEALNDKNLVDSPKGVFTLTVSVRKQIEDAGKDIENILKTIR